MTTSFAATISVVICDDHRVVAQGLSAVLAAEGDIVVLGVAGTVAEVVDMVGSRHPDLVLMDYELPDGDGVAATRALKQGHLELHVVMLTSFSNEEVMVAAIEAGCSGFVTKHSGAEALAEAVRRAASGEAVIAASMLEQLLSTLTPTQRGLGADLTPRELQVLELLAGGASGRAIAEHLYLSTNTVRNYSQRILDKLCVHSRLEAVAVAVQEGIIRRPVTTTHAPR